MAKKILITGGGSGGHLNTAIGVIEYIKKTDPELFANLVYVGGIRGMVGDSTPSLESRKIPELGIRFIAIRSGKFHRKLSSSSLQLFGGVLGGFSDAMKVLGQEKPDVVFSTGGYVTVPLVIAAGLRKIPVVIHEQTVVSGLANRINAKFARKVLLTFKSSKTEFPAEKVKVVGNPIRASRFITKLPADLPAEYEEFLTHQAKKDRKPFIFIMGGGLGSHKLNMWVAANLNILAKDYNVLLQTGENKLTDDFTHLREHVALLPKELQENVFVTPWFKEEIGFIYHHADLVICRPGANSVLELLALNKRAIFVPIPWSSHGEQQLNAEYFCNNQTGAIVNEADINTELNEKLITDMLAKPTKNNAELVPTDVEPIIVKELLKY